MRRVLLTTTLVAGSLLANNAANAVLQISANINGTSFTCFDNEASCDTNGNIGQLAIADQTIAGVQFLGSAQTQVIGPTNSLNTTSFQIINNNANSVPITLAVSGTNFVGPVAHFSASSSGTFQSAIGSSATFAYTADAANTQGASTPTDLPGTVLVPGGDVENVTLATQGFGFNHNGNFAATGLYSMSLGTSGTLTAGGSLVGRSQAIVTEQVVPEPGALGLLGAGLALLGLTRLRRRR